MIVLLKQTFRIQFAFMLKATLFITQNISLTLRISKVSDNMQEMELLMLGQVLRVLEIRFSGYTLSLIRPEVFTRSIVAMISISI